MFCCKMRAAHVTHQDAFSHVLFLPLIGAFGSFRTRRTSPTPSLLVCCQGRTHCSDESFLSHSLSCSIVTGPVGALAQVRQAGQHTNPLIRRRGFSFQQDEAIVTGLGLKAASRQGRGRRRLAGMTTPKHAVTKRPSRPPLATETCYLPAPIPARHVSQPFLHIIHRGPLLIARLPRRSGLAPGVVARGLKRTDASQKRLPCP